MSAVELPIKLEDRHVLDRCPKDITETRNSDAAPDRSLAVHAHLLESRCLMAKTSQTDPSSTRGAYRRLGVGFPPAAGTNVSASPGLSLADS